MSKRFTDTNKYKKPFVRNLPGPYKLLWDYLYHDCDHTGIWIVDFEVAQIYLGADMPIDKATAIEYFNADEERIIEFDNGKKWFIKPFISFQYGELNSQNRAHNSVISALTINKLLEYVKPLISPLQGAKDKDKDKDKDKVQDFGKSENLLKPTEVFERVLKIWNSFSGKKAVSSDVNTEQQVWRTINDSLNGCNLDNFVAAMENYRMALHLPDSQAWKCNLYHFAQGNFKKFLPGAFDIDNYKKSNFEKSKQPPKQDLKAMAEKLKQEGRL